MGNKTNYTIEFSLNSQEYFAFEKYCEDAGVCYSAVVPILIRQFLMKQPQLVKNELISDARAERLDSLERELKHVESLVECLCKHDEKMDEKIAGIEEVLARLVFGFKHLNDDKSTDVVSTESKFVNE